MKDSNNSTNNTQSKENLTLLENTLRDLEEIKDQRPAFFRASLDRLSAAILQQ